MLGIETRVCFFIFPRPGAMVVGVEVVVVVVAVVANLKVTLPMLPLLLLLLSLFYCIV